MHTCQRFLHWHHPQPYYPDRPHHIRLRISRGVVRRADGWQVPALKSAGRWYLWSPGRRWIAFQTEADLWAVSPDGRTEHLLQAGDRSRQLTGWWEGCLVFVDYGPGGGDGPAAVRVARPGEQTRTITELKGTVPTLGLGTVVYGPYLGIWQDGCRPLQLDLRTGALHGMGEELVPARSAMPLLSPSGRYALGKNVSGWDRLRVYDLQEGASLRSEEAVYPYSSVWAPLDDRWAAIAGPPGSGSADGGAFGTALDVGDPGLNLTHLQPPMPLKRAPPLPLAIAQQFRNDDLPFRPPYVSWVEYDNQSPAPRLVVARRPDEVNVE